MPKTCKRGSTSRALGHKTGRPLKRTPLSPTVIWRTRFDGGVAKRLLRRPCLFVLFALFELLLEFGALFGLDVGTLLALHLKLLFGAEQFDECRFCAIALRKPVRTMRR